MKTLGLLAFFVASAALAQVQLPDGYLNGSNGASGSITPVSVCPKNSNGKTDWAIFANDYLSFNQAGDACGSVPNGPWMSYQTGVGFLQIGGGSNGLLIGTNAQSLGVNIATQQNVRSLEIQQASGHIAIDFQTAGAQICFANGSDCWSDSSGALTPNAAAGTQNLGTASAYLGTIFGNSFQGEGNSSVAAVNVTASNSVVGGTNGVFGNGAACSGGAAIALQDNGGSGSDPNVFACGTNTNNNIQLSSKGSGNVVLAPGSTGSVVPSSANTFSLGTASIYWSNVFANAFTGEGTSSLSVTNATIGNTAGITTNAVIGNSSCAGVDSLRLQDNGGGGSEPQVSTCGSNTNIPLYLSSSGSSAIVLTAGTTGSVQIAGTTAPQLSFTGAATAQIAQASTQTIIFGKSSPAAASTNGGFATVASEPGGAASGANAGIGGTMQVQGGNGGAGSTTFNGGNGAATNILSGSGGAGGTTGTGGTGGGLSVSTGSGGVAGSTTGAAGASGVLFLQTGTGGAASAAVAAGASGSITIQTGAAGSNVLGGGGAGTGNITIDTGTPTGAGTAGNINIGTLNANQVSIGRSGQTVLIKGVAITPDGDWSLTMTDPVTVIGNTSDFELFGPLQNASTIRSCSCAVNALGTGTGTETWKVTSGSSGTGTLFMTVVVPCTAAAGQNCSSCTINQAAVPAGTTLHGAVTTACATADVTSHILAGMTTP